jgi:hypothetical protein
MRLGARATIDLADGFDVGDIALESPTTPVDLTTDLVAPFQAVSQWSITAKSPGGASLTLGDYRANEHEADVYTIPGVSYELHASATTIDGAGQSHVLQAVAPGDRVTPEFLFPPVPTRRLTLAAGAAWQWWPEPNVDGYRVEITGSSLPKWEAYTPVPRLKLPVGLPMSPARARIIAASEGGISRVAGLRALRVFAPPTRYAFWEGPL